MLCSSHLCSIFTEIYLEEYSRFVLVVGETPKIRENSVTKAARAKAFVKYMMIGWSDIRYWTWEFLLNMDLIKVQVLKSESSRRVL